MTTTTRARLVTLIDNLRNLRAQAEGWESDRWNVEECIAEHVQQLHDLGFVVGVVEFSRTWGEGDSEQTYRFELASGRVLRVLVVETFTPTL